MNKNIYIWMVVMLSLLSIVYAAPSPQVMMIGGDSSFQIRWGSLDLNAFNLKTQTIMDDVTSYVSFQDYIFSALIDEPGNCTLYGNWTGSWIKNETISVEPVIPFNFTTISNLDFDNNYQWRINCTGDASNTEVYSDNQTFTVSANVFSMSYINISTVNDWSNYLFDEDDTRCQFSFATTGSTANLTYNISYFNYTNQIYSSGNLNATVGDNNHTMDSNNISMGMNISCMVTLTDGTSSNFLTNPSSMLGVTYELSVTEYILELCDWASSAYFVPVVSWFRGQDYEDAWFIRNTSWLETFDFTQNVSATNESNLTYWPRQIVNDGFDSNWSSYANIEDYELRWNYTLIDNINMVNITVRVNDSGTLWCNNKTVNGTWVNLTSVTNGYNSKQVDTECWNITAVGNSSIEFMLNRTNNSWGYLFYESAVNWTFINQTANQQDVPTIDQNDSICTFNLTNQQNYNTTLIMYMNQTHSDFDVKCSFGSNLSSAATFLNATNETVVRTSIGVNETVCIWCWADYSTSNWSDFLSFDWLFRLIFSNW